MRPFLPLTLLVAASLVLLPATGRSQNAGEDPGDNNAASADMAPAAKVLSKEEQAEAKRLARQAREREEERLRAERALECRIKPVMTDAEIARCKEVWR